MIIDFNTHIGDLPDHSTGCNLNCLMGTMTRSSVDISVASDLRTAFERNSDDRLEGCSDSRIIRFLSIGPESASDRPIGESVAGVRIYPTYQSWDFAGERWKGLLDQAKAEKLIVQIYLRLRDPRCLQQTNDSSLVLQPLADSIAQYVDVDFVISGSFYAEIQNFIGLFGKDNVWLDIAHLQSPVNSLQKLLAILDKSRILFGSNAPFFYMYSNVFRVQNSGISDEEQCSILEGNARRLLMSKGRLSLES